ARHGGEGAETFGAVVVLAEHAAAVVEDLHEAVELTAGAGAVAEVGDLRRQGGERLGGGDGDHVGVAFGDLAEEGRGDRVGGIEGVVRLGLARLHGAARAATVAAGFVAVVAAFTHVP